MHKLCLTRVSASPAEGAETRRGRKIYEGKLSFDNGMLQFSVPDRIPGLYLLKLTDAKGRKFMLKFVVSE